MTDINDIAWQHASKLTEEAEKRQVLEWFVNRVREGKEVNSAVMEFIADGVEQHLKGGKPWGAKRGKKKRSVDHELVHAVPIHEEYQRIGFEHLITNRCVDPEYVLVTTAGELGISVDTVKRAIASVKKYQRSHSGIYRALVEIEIFKRFLRSPDGQAYLKTPEGREAWGDSPIVHEIMNQTYK